jgi:hypothetical protein
MFWPEMPIAWKVKVLCKCACTVDSYLIYSCQTFRGVQIFVCQFWGASFFVWQTISADVLDWVVAFEFSSFMLLLCWLFVCYPTILLLAVCVCEGYLICYFLECKYSYYRLFYNIAVRLSYYFLLCRCCMMFILSWINKASYKIKAGKVGQ